MTIITAADIVLHLARHLRDHDVCKETLCRTTGVPEDRLTMIQAGKWEKLTIREIAAVSRALDVDLAAVITGCSSNA